MLNLFHGFVKTDITCFQLHSVVWPNHCEIYNLNIILKVLMKHTFGSSLFSWYWTRCKYGGNVKRFELCTTKYL